MLLKRNVMTSLQAHKHKYINYHKVKLNILFITLHLDESCALDQENNLTSIHKLALLESTIKSTKAPMPAKYRRFSRTTD